MPRPTTTGGRLEDFVAGLLEEARYDFVPHGFFFAMREMGQRIYTRQVTVGRDIYAKNRRVDFMVFHPVKWPNALVIQCKWQAVGGSVEEKYPFEVLNIQQGGYPTIVLLDGGGYTKGAEQWLRGQAGKNLLKHVFNQGEFQRFVARGEL